MIPASFDLNNVDEFQLEITGYCNAACPQCPRNLNGDRENPYLNKEHLPRDTISLAFTPEITRNLRQIFFCGNYGDPIMHPEFMDIIKDFMFKNPDIWIYMHTNGGARKPEWWAELARVIGPNGRVGFNIDGLNDTNHLYRCGTDFTKIMDNAEAFIKAGGRAEWNYIVFKHNQHQVETARDLANIIGFESFNERATGRFLNYNDFSELEKYPKTDKNGEVQYYIENPTSEKFKNSSMLALPKIKEKYSDMTKYFSETEINCDSLCRHKGNAHRHFEKSKLLITSNGIVLPCNFFNHNLQDARFHDRSIIPGANDLSFLPNGKNQVRDFLEQYNFEYNLNIKYNSITNILQNKFWSDLVDSFNKPLGEGRIFECALTCGREFYKVWDQLHSQHNTFLITGGNKGLGKDLVDYFNGTCIARSDNADIRADITNPDDRERIAEESLKYDVFVNNAFDGPAGEAHANFAQTELLIKVFDKWKEANKQGYIINIGSASIKEIVVPDPTFERYRVTKAALEHASKQCTKAFKENRVPFKTSIINFDRLDTPLSRSRSNWTGNGTPLEDVVKTVEFMLDSSPNTCIEEVTSWLNRYYGHGNDNK